jgi:superfamily II DNA helicase RecQ
LELHELKARTFTLPFDVASNRFDDSELLAFLADTEALSIAEHFFLREGEPLWAILVTFRQPRAPGEAAPQRTPSDPATELDPADRAVFEAIRSWRNQKAKKMNRPAYVLLTNEQASDVARLRPSTLTALTSIPGIGEAKAKDFGAELLSLIAGLAPAPGGEPTLVNGEDSHA